MNLGAPPAWRTGCVHAAGARVATFETGSDAHGASVVVLLHGLGHWSEAAWGRLAPELDPNLRYIALDLPGFGASDKPEAAYDRAYFRRIIESVVAALELRRFALAGHSLGGLIAADYAGAHPEQITCLALIAPAGFVRTWRFVVYGLAGALARWAFTIVPSRRFVGATFRKGVADPASLDATVVERAYALSQDKGLRLAFARVYVAGIWDSIHRRALHAAFARYAGPVFCAWGRNDRYLPIRALRAVERVYPQVHTLVLERSGHLPAIEEPERLGAALRAFFAPHQSPMRSSST